jgi:sugar lactone lactonase YvrE
LRRFFLKKRLFSLGSFVETTGITGRPQTIRLSRLARLWQQYSQYEDANNGGNMTISNRSTRTLLGILMIVALPVAASAQLPSFETALTPQQFGPPLETVKTFDAFKLVGIGVSHDGRVFASAPAARTGNRLVEVNAKTGAVTPYPDHAWNAPDTSAKQRWVVPQAMWVDKVNRLWVLDTGRAVLTAGAPGAPPKLVEFNLATNKVIRSYGFGRVVAPSDSLNDVRVDLVHGYAYLTNIANKGSLVVLNLKTGSSRQVLVGDRSTQAAAGQHLMIGKQPAALANGTPAVINADGIALSPHAAWLYYRPLTDHNYWRVSTAALIDQHLSPAALSKKVEFLGSGPLTGGLIMDQRGTLYGGNLEDSSVVALTLDPTTHKLNPKLFARDLGRLSWADGFAISDGYLYISDSHLWEVAFKNHLQRSGPFTIFRVKLPE